MTGLYTLNDRVCTTVDLLFIMMRPPVPAKGGWRELRKRDKHGRARGAGGCKGAQPTALPADRGFRPGPGGASDKALL